MTTPTDHDALLKRAIAGDTEALMQLLEALGERVRPRIEAKITGALRASIDADDVMQVTYIEAVTRLKRFKEGDAAGFLAWLSRLAENNLIDAVRELEAAKRPNPRNRVSAAPGEESMVALVEMLGTHSRTPSRSVARGEAKGFLERALSNLPPDYERVIRLYDLEGKGIGEVAKELGRSEGAVFMLRARAHDRLRDAMGPGSNFFSTPG